MGWGAGMSSMAKKFALGVKLILARLGSAITGVARVMTSGEREAREYETRRIDASGSGRPT